MSKHINFKVSDTLYGHILQFMRDNNISNLSWAIRICLLRYFDYERKEIEREEELNEHKRNIIFLRENNPF